MNGLRFDFESNDIIIGSNGSFETSNIDGQNCALIALSQICIITKPEVGEQLASKLQNRKTRSVSADVSAAIRAVEADGGRNVIIEVDDDEQLFFDANYDN